MSDNYSDEINRGAELDICVGHSKFVDSEADYTFLLQGVTIRLKHHPDVFPPSSFGLKFAEKVDFSRCQRAADIGTGTGLLAILAAKKGVEKVVATDLSELAIQLTTENARKMSVTEAIEARRGHYFNNFGGSFDVITANLPQEIIPPAYENALSAPQIQAIDGGGDGGNEVLLNFLDIAPDYMHRASELYVIVNTITDYRKTLQKITDVYDAKLVWEGTRRAKQFVGENIGFYSRLIENGIISLRQDEIGNWHARQYIFRLSLRS